MVSKIDGKVESIEGHWINGKLHGFAKARYANGDFYTGFYKGKTILLICLVA